MKSNVPTNLTFDAKKFVQAMVVNLNEAINYAYPVKTYTEGRAHTALQMIQSNVNNLASFLVALQEVPADAPIPEESPKAVYLLINQNAEAVFEGTLKSLQFSHLKTPDLPVSPTQAQLLAWAEKQKLSLYRKLG